MAEEETYLYFNQEKVTFKNLKGAQDEARTNCPAFMFEYFSFSTDK